MSLLQSVRDRLVSKVHRSRAHTQPDSLLQLRSIIDDYEVAETIERNGKIPLNYFTFRPNFGDLLSPWLVQQMTGKEVAIADRNKPHYVAIGSIISQGTNQSIVWGAGAYGTEGSAEVSKNAQFTAVRGPLTRAKLSAAKGFGIPVPQIYGDPALLLPGYYLPDVPITHEYGVIVRWSERSWAQATYGSDVKMIDFGREDVESVIRELLSCRKIITSSLHGLIVADAYGVPSAWLASDSPRGGVFKFYDYFASVGKFRQAHDFDPTTAPVTAERLRGCFTVSGDDIQFDHRKLLDAAPFVQRKMPTTDPSGVSVPSRETGPRRHSQKPGRGVLLPSLGYFGGIAANYLSVSVTGPVARIRLFLPDCEGELDLRGVELFSRGRRVKVSAQKMTTAQSSAPSDSESRTSPFAFGGIRTKKEVGPWWSVTFDPPIEVDELRVYNRRDGWGSRSRALTVAVGGPDGYFRTVRSVNSDRVIEDTFAVLRRLSGYQLGTSVLSSEERARKARHEVLGELAGLATESLITADRDEQRLLFSLLCTRRARGAKTLSDDEWTLLGHLIAAERRRVPSTGTSIRSFHMVLDSRSKLRRLEDEVNRAGDVLGLPQAMLTRHGFTDVGALQERADDYVGLMQRVIATLGDCGYAAMLAYGTLLGAVREGNFLAHDDDIDLFIPTNATTRNSVEDVLASLAEQLRSRGWHTSRPNSYTNFHLIDPASKLHADVFPLLVNGDRTSLHMEKMRLREIPTDMLLPPRSVTFLGQEMPVPADPEAFLTERYGKDWTTPDPFYDWPWKLEE